MTEADIPTPEFNEVKIVKKIQALLHLSESDNPHESMKAMERAQYLIEKYSISREKLNPKNEFISMAYWTGKELIMEAEYIVPVLIAFYHVRFHLLEPDEDHKGLDTHPTSLVAIGLPHHVKIAGQLFVYLHRQYTLLFDKWCVNTGIHKHYKPDEWVVLRPHYARDFYRGITSLLFENLKAGEESIKEEFQQEGLVLVPDTQLEQLMEETEDQCKTMEIWVEKEHEMAKMSDIGSFAAFDAGATYGTTIQLNPAIEAQATKTQTPSAN